MNDKEIEAEAEDVAEDKRLKRQEYLIDKRLESFVNVLAQIKKCQEEFESEILEFQMSREELATNLQKSIKDSMASLTPVVGKILKGYLEESTSKLSESIQGSLQQVQKEAETTIASLKKVLEEEDQSRLFKGLIRNGISLLTALIVAGVIFYFFPQTRYVHYEMTNEQAQDVLWGRALRKNKQALNLEAKKAIADTLEEDLNKLMGIEKAQTSSEKA